MIARQAWKSRVESGPRPSRRCIRGLHSRNTSAQGLTGPGRSRLPGPRLFKLTHYQSPGDRLPAGQGGPRLASCSLAQADGKPTDPHGAARNRRAAARPAPDSEGFDLSKVAERAYLIVRQLHGGGCRRSREAPEEMGREPELFG